MTSSPTMILIILKGDEAPPTIKEQSRPYSLELFETVNKKFKCF